jgi:hypothetical protein
MLPCGDELRRSGRNADGSVNVVSGPAITSCPERTFWAFRSFRIVNALFMRTPDDPVSHNHRFDLMTFDEGENLGANSLVISHIPRFREPALQILRIGVVSAYYTHSHFARPSVIPPVERDRRDGVTAETPACLFMQRSTFWFDLHCSKPLTSLRENYQLKHHHF